ncbi:MAG: nuclear transport factor 2 family protein, partial [Longicatena sp.]
MDAWNKKSIIDFIQRLLKIYFETRDVVHLSEYMRDDISWIGTGQGEFSNSFEESMRSLLKDKEEYSGCFEIKNTDLDITFLDDNVCVVYGNVYAIAQDSKIAPEHLRLTFVVENMDGTLKVTHLHSSHPDNNQGDGNYFVKQEDREDNKYLRQALHDRNRQLADLIENIPGGIHQCKDDEDITLISMSDAFLTMFGYTKEEIGTLFDNKFMNMIHPADRKGMLESMKEQLKHGIK